MRIATVAACPFPWPRGTPIRIHRLSEALARRGHEVHVFTYHLGERLVDPPFVIHRIRDVPAYTHTEPGPTWGKFTRLDPMLARLLRRLDRKLRFDVIHAHHYEGILAASRFRLGAPIVYDAHTTLAGELPQYRLGAPESLLRWAGAILDRHLPRRANRVIAVSETIRDRLVSIRAVRADHVHVIPNGVDPEKFAAAPPGPRHGETVIFTGNLSPYQGVDLLLEAFAELRRHRPRARLQIVTESDFAPYEAETLRLAIRDAVDVCRVPFAMVPPLLAAADVAVSPRVTCDGIPQKLLNYMAAGKPIVAFEGSAVHLQHEVTGLRVPDRDIKAMAAAIRRLLDDRTLADRLAAAARDQVRREFSWDSAAERVEQVYRQARER